MKKEPTSCFFLLGVVSVLVLAGGMTATPIKITNTPSWYDASPRMAVDSIGNIHLVWAQYYGTASPTTTTGDAMYSKYDIFTKQWTTPLNLSNNSQVHSNEYRPIGIDVDGSDNVYVIYVERVNRRIMMRINYGGSWGAPFVVSTTSGSYDTARVAVTPNGNIYACWWNMGTYVCYSRARIAGTWESVRAVSVGAAKFPDIAVGANVAFMTWTARNQAGIYQIYYAWRSTAYNVSWSSPQLLSANTLKQQTPAIEVDSLDIAHIVFAQFIAEGGIRRMDYSYWQGTGFSSPLPLSRSTLSHYPSMCDRGNNIFVAWQIGAWLGGTSVNYNNQIIGRWTGEESIDGSQGSTYPDVAVSPYQNEVYYVWDSGQELFFDIKVIYSFGQLPVFNGHDYDGDKDSDVSLFRPDRALWCIKDVDITFFGLPGDIPVPGDYDGNGTTDVAIFRPSRGLWAIKDQSYDLFGEAGDIPVPGDYDGNGTTDIAVYRPSTGDWHVKDQFTVHFGGGGNIVVPGDYDGDGKTDLALFNPSTGLWHIRNQLYVVYGKSGDIPVPADYNGDGKTDLAIFRPSRGLWAVRDLFYALYGKSGDIPAPGDYDGNGTADVAIFRPSRGLWAIKDQFYIIYGREGDVPLVR